METRKTKKDEKPDNRELELEERELQWQERKFEEERRKRMRMEEKMGEEKMEWRERMAETQIEHEKQMMQMQAIIPLKSQNNGEEEAHTISKRRNCRIMRKRKETQSNNPKLP